MNIFQSPHIEDGFQASSVVIGEQGGTPYGLYYRLLIDRRWHVRELFALLVNGPRLRMTSDGEGTWHDDEENEVKELSGCIDVDIAATPFTNALPIRRLGLKSGKIPISR